MHFPRHDHLSMFVCLFVCVLFCFLLYFVLCCVVLCCVVLCCVVLFFVLFVCFFVCLFVCCCFFFFSFFIFYYSIIMINIIFYLIHVAQLLTLPSAKFSQGKATLKLSNRLYSNVYDFTMKLRIQVVRVTMTNTGFQFHSFMHGSNEHNKFP